MFTREGTYAWYQADLAGYKQSIASLDGLRIGSNSAWRPLSADALPVCRCRHENQFVVAIRAGKISERVLPAAFTVLTARCVGPRKRLDLGAPSMRGLTLRHGRNTGRKVTLRYAMARSQNRHRVNLHYKAAVWSSLPVLRCYQYDGSVGGGDAKFRVHAARPLWIGELPPIGKLVTMVKPLVKPNIVKKRTKPFKRHQCDRKITVKVNLIICDAYKVGKTA